MSQKSDEQQGEIRDRAVGGVVSVGLRNLAVRGLGLAGNVVLARLLTPEDFGVVAFGLTITVLASALATGGIGASLVRRAEEPPRHHLAVTLGFQLLTTLVITAVVVAVGATQGRTGLIAAIMILALPIDAFRLPAGIVTTRRLEFGLLARVEVIEVVVFNVVSVGLVVAGLGVWGVAVASVVRAVAASALFLRIGPVGWVTPAWDWPVLSEHLRFGLAQQSTTLLTATRDQGLNLLVAAVGGLAALGVWALAYRLLQTVLLLLQALWRVAFPATARLIDAGADPRRLLARGMAMIALATGLLTVALAGPAPATVPTLFGPGWEAVVPVMPWGAAALMVSGPISTTGMGYLWAMGDGGRVLLCVAAQTVVWLGTTAALLPGEGATAVGIGMLAGSVVLAVAVTAAVRRRTRVPVLGVVAVPTLAAAASSGAAWLVARAVGEDVFGLAASMATGLGLYVALAALLRRSDLIRMISLVRGALPGVRGRRGAAAPGAA